LKSEARNPFLGFTCARSFTVSSNSISSTMTTYEGIKSFYDYRKVTAEQLKKDAQQLIDVSNNKNGLAKQIVAASEQREMADGKWQSGKQ